MEFRQGRRQRVGRVQKRRRQRSRESAVAEYIGDKGMKKYKYIGTKEQLKENGFEITYSTKSGNPFFAVRNTFETNKISHKIFVSLYTDNYGGYEQGYMSDNWKNTEFDITPYIQDLIALGLVVEV